MIRKIKNIFILFLILSITITPVKATSHIEHITPEYEYFSITDFILLLRTNLGDKESIPSDIDRKEQYWADLCWIDPLKTEKDENPYNELISRKLACKLMVNAANLPLLYPSNYGDMEQDPYVFTAEKYGLIKPLSDGKLHINHVLTKTQAYDAVEAIINLSPVEYSNNIPIIIKGYNEVETLNFIKSKLTLVPKNILNEFEYLGYTIEVYSREEYLNCKKATPKQLKQSSAFYFKPERIIVFNSLTERTILHEFGHFVAEEFCWYPHIEKLFNNKEEVEAITSLIGSDYAKSSAKEFFADSFVCYNLYKEQLKQKAPNTYNYIDSQMENINFLT